MDITTETWDTAKAFNERHRGLYGARRYFRFNEQQGLQKVGLEEHKAAGLKAAAAAEHMDGQETKSAAKYCTVLVIIICFLGHYYYRQTEISQPQQVHALF